MYPGDIREFMKEEVLGDNQLSFDTFAMYWKNAYPFLKLVCFTRYLVPFNERVDKRYRLERFTLNDDNNGQFLPNCYIILTTDKKGTGAGHFKLVTGEDEVILKQLLETTD